jgi:KaiC/GvpD/RAD55 family RecA-like ATPase
MSSNENADKAKPKIFFTQIGREETIERALPVITGYTILDTLLCGGLPQKFAVLITSPPCDEKDLLIKRFLETGVENDESTFYVTIEPSLAESLAQHKPSNFYMFLCNPQGEAILKSASNISILKGVENLTDLSVALTSTIRKLDPSHKGPRRMCLNIISDVLLLHGSVQTRRWLTELLTQLKSVGFTTIAIIDPQIHPPEQLHAILGLFEGEVNIREAETDQGLGRFLKIKRMSNQKYLKDEAYLTEDEQQNQRISSLEDSKSRGFIRLS